MTLRQLQLCKFSFRMPRTGFMKSPSGEGSCQISDRLGLSALGATAGWGCDSTTEDGVLI